MSSGWTSTAALYGFTAVGFGAFGAHGLQSRGVPPQKIASWGSAAQYQLIHSVVLLVVEQAAPQNMLAKRLFTAGMTMFSGSIYLLILSPDTFRPLGPVTPLGGLALMGGWLALAFGSRGRIGL